MGVYTLKSGSLAVMVVSMGAEIKSVKDCKTGLEYMWNANPIYWKRTSPILFPVVGNCKNQEMRYNGRVYTMPQHGFARDMDFELLSLKQNEAWFGLSSTPDTLRRFPFPFRLEIGYEVLDRMVKVHWRVVNTGRDTMYFSIGGHPAFICPERESDRQSDYYIGFEGLNEVVCRTIEEGGVASDRLVTYPLEDGLLRITEDLFNDDALVVENHQTQRVSLCTPDRKPYVTVSFDAPLFGVWSVPRKEAPFVCIEPWYGRCDHKDFSGTLQEREWGNHLEKGEVFETSYTIELE